MKLETTLALTSDSDQDDVQGHLYRLNGRPLERPEGPDVFLVRSMGLSGLDRRLHRPNRDPGAVLDEDKPRKQRRFRKH
jgi:hypothetical protein